MHHSCDLFRNEIGEQWLSIGKKNISLKEQNELWIDVHEFRSVIGTS